MAELLDFFNINIFKKPVGDLRHLETLVSNFDLKLSTNNKITANRIFDLRHRIYDQKNFSWIYMNSTSVDVYNTYQSLIRRYKVLIYFLVLFSTC